MKDSTIYKLYSNSFYKQKDKNLFKKIFKGNLNQIISMIRQVYTGMTKILKTQTVLLSPHTTLEVDILSSKKIKRKVKTVKKKVYKLRVTIRVCIILKNIENLLTKERVIHYGKK